MFKNQISKKGMYEAPEDKEVDILLYAAQSIKKEEEIDILEYMNWLPFLGFILLLKDTLTGYKLRIKPAIKI